MNIPIIKINAENFEEYILSFLGEDEEFLLREDLTSIVGNEIIFVGYIQNLKYATLEKSIIKINLSKLITK